MMRYFFVLLLSLFLLPQLSLFGMEFEEGNLRLILHPHNGSFSLYAIDGERQEALFYDVDPTTSFLSVMVDNRIYRPGSSSAFSISIDKNAENPRLVYESSFLIITKDFHFIIGENQSEASGISITISVINRSENGIYIAARYVLDTNLSDTTLNVTYDTNRRRRITGETLLTRAGDSDLFWLDINSRGRALSGSLFTGSAGDPDRVLFANWQRLNEAPWNISYHEGRNFNLMPFSIRDSAIAYYFDPRYLPSGTSFSYNFLLMQRASDIAYLVYGVSETWEGEIAELSERDRDLLEIRNIINQIDALTASGQANEDELSSLELSLAYLMAKYNIRH